MTLEDHHETCVASDVADITSLVIDWVEHGWHLKRGDTFDFRTQLSRFYDWESTDVLLHDNADPDRTIARSVAEYAAIWDRSLVTLTTLSNTIDDGPHVVLSGHLAVVDVCFSTRFEFQGGHVDVTPTRSSLALRRKGRHWLIFREHGSALTP
jgi:hypothetical protein